ncbi:MAG: L,D-transpeptidase family protein [Burkholderiales bacterium]
MPTLRAAAMYAASALGCTAFAQGSTAAPAAASSVAAGVGATSVPSAATSTAPFANEVEGALVRTLEILRDGGIKPALREIENVLAKNPNFRLGHMLRGDLLMAKAGSPVALSGPVEARTPPQAATNITNLQHEARVRLGRYFDAPPEDALPTALLQLAPNHEHAILVDIERSRLYVFRNVDGKPQRVIDFYTTIGKRGSEKAREGDQKTPLGVYHITSTVAKERLTDFYGPGAFPINFPNDIDRKLGRTGSGIWIHGTPPDTYSRPPWASDGCVVLTNDDFRKLVPFVDPGTTPVVIAPTVEWQPTQEWLAFRESFGTQLNKWKQDWESLNMDSYLAHYSTRFDAEGKDFREWSSHKRRVNAQKSFVKVEIRNLSVFEYNSALNQPPMMMVTFDQDYKSSNNNTRMKKRQYWQREDGRWKIIFEGSAS